MELRDRQRSLRRLSEPVAELPAEFAGRLVIGPNLFLGEKSGDRNDFPLRGDPLQDETEFIVDRRHVGDCLEIGGVRPQLLLAGADRWRAGISVRSRSRACQYRRRCEPEAEDPPLAATSAFAAICSSGGSPENWPSLR